ncbi:enoyl-CoA hydratase-related protein [Arthrobacter rhombi]|uniref:enoyl-CoA hydratase/isomerase family protein n=1 Tax=Arthrobacter rhombi TaxID=71253 RepID=UPI0031D35009
MIGDRVTLAIANGIAHLELSRPVARNAMDPTFVEEFGATIDRVAADSSVRTLLITAQGPSFCVGGDLKHFAANTDRHEEILCWMVDHWHEVLGRLSALDIPVVTAVQGGTAGGGLGPVWCADYVIAAESTRMAGGFADIGLSGDGGASWHLPRYVGLRRAQAMILDNLPIDAATALEWGIVNAVVPDVELVDAAWAAARRFSRRSATAFSQAKRLLAASSTNGYLEHLQAEAEAIHTCAAAADSAEGIMSFLAKEQPTFTDGYPSAVSTFRR